MNTNPHLKSQCLKKLGFLVCCWGNLTMIMDVHADLTQITNLMETGTSRVRIVCFGDSITSIYYHTGSQRAWCDMLGIALRRIYPKSRIEMINSGVSGNSTTDALVRIDKDVLAHNPDLVIVMFGMNDLMQMTPNKFQEQLDSIVQRCVDAGATVMLCTTNSVFKTSNRTNPGLQVLAKCTKQIGSKWQVSIVDLFREWQKVSKWDQSDWMLLMSDDIHPNMIGHKWIAELIAKNISGKSISLNNVRPSAIAMRTTFDRLERENLLKVVAMPPYNKLVPELIKHQYPDAKIQVTVSVL